jgi:hypothetical protein
MQFGGSMAFELGSSASVHPEIRCGETGRRHRGLIKILEKLMKN